MRTRNSLRIPIASAILQVFLSVLLLCTYPGKAAAAETGSWEVSPIAVPLGTGKYTMEVTIVVNGKNVTKPVTIPSGKIVPWVRPLRQPTDTDKEYAQKLADSKGEASQAKAKVITDAINAEFKNEFAQLGQTVMTAIKQVTGKVSVGGVPIEVTAPFGAFIVPSVSKEQGNPIKITEGRILGESGNAGRYLPPGRPSPGARGSLERSTPGVTTVATGFQTVDTDNDPPLTFPPSNVEFGIGGTYVAEFTPTPGMTDAEVLSTLSSMLNLHGIPATFDPIQVELFLDNPIPDGDFLVWGTSDPGLEFTLSMEGLVVAPEPPPLALLLSGLLVFGFIKRFQ